jgi:hypothetical protein
MSTLLRSAVIVVLVLVAIVVLMACGEGLCGECADGCCVNADRFESLRRAARRILGALGRVVLAVSSLLGTVLRSLSSAFELPAPSLAIAQVSSLRI